MSMSEQWEPKADDFRQVWAGFSGYGGLVARPSSVSIDERYAEFDRWLDRERAVARREGWGECALAIQDGLGAWDAFERYGSSETEEARHVDQ